LIIDKLININKLSLQYKQGHPVVRAKDVGCLSEPVIIPLVVVGIQTAAATIVVMAAVQIRHCWSA